MSPLVVFILLTHLTYISNVVAAGVVPQVQKNANDEEEEPVKKDHEIVVNIIAKHGEPAVAAVKNPENSEQLPPKIATTVAVNNVTVSEHKKFKTAEVMESGALVRGVLVVVALSVLVMIYMAVKTYYGRRNRTAMVRKYGVRTRRSDIEMTPLPLDEDEEDETLFEVGAANR